MLDILQKAPAGFAIKAFNVEGVKLDLFCKYREALNLNPDEEFTADSLVETIKPFLIFYKKLNKYTKQTRRLQKSTLEFRSVLAKATDPEKTFFEDLPYALGFSNTDIVGSNEVLQRYVELLQKAIRELRTCYSNLIGRLERAVVEELGLQSTDYLAYKEELAQLYANIKTYLLTERQKTFLTRILAKNVDRTTWYQSLAYIVLDKPLDTLLDEEESYLIDNLVHSFKELQKFIDVSNKNFTPSDHFIRFEMITAQGAIDPCIIQLNNQKTEQAQSLEKQIDQLLSGDNEVDAYVLLSIIQKKLKK